MSIQAISFVGAIGLLGEYCPSSKRGRPLSDKISCMHLESFSKYPEFRGCNWWQPSFITEEQSSLVQESLEDNIAADLHLRLSICSQ